MGPRILLVLHGDVDVSQGSKLLSCGLHTNLDVDIGTCATQFSPNVHTVGSLVCLQNLVANVTVRHVFQNPSKTHRADMSQDTSRHVARHVFKKCRLEGPKTRRGDMSL